MKEKELLISIQARSLTIVKHDKQVEIILGHEISLEIPPAASIVPTRHGAEIVMIYTDEVVTVSSKNEGGVEWVK